MYGIITVYIILILHLLLPVYGPRHEYSECPHSCHVHLLICQILAPSEKPEDTQTVENPEKRTQEGRQDDTLVTLIFIVVRGGRIEGHRITYQVEGVYEEFQILLIEIGT